MPARILVTSGGTSEPVDRVRKITNSSTGRLGSLIADAFTGLGAQVDYLCGETALRPSLPTADEYPVGSVSCLAETLERLLRERSYRCIVHAMAVSDYRPRCVSTAKALATELFAAISTEPCPPREERFAELLSQALHRTAQGPNGKLSSHLEDMILLMERTPKLIGRVKTLQPGALLIGFKLLAGVGETELVRVAQELMARAGCDYVLANDQEQIRGDCHPALLVGPGGVMRRMRTKQEIADVIAQTVMIEEEIR